MSEKKNSTSGAEEKNAAVSVKEQSTEIAIIDERTIRDKIYEVRGVKVMLDFEIAEIYGYTTSAFNQQVRRNEGKFPADFRFQLTKDEYQILLSQNVTASWGGDRRTEPWVFTESGIYMLMSVLKGDLATRQSIALIRTFRAMKDYIVENQGLVNQRDLLKISMQTTENTEAIRQVQSVLMDQHRLLVEHDDKLADVLEQLNDTVKSSEISPFLLDFSKPEDQREYLLMNGQPAKADETYIGIYSKAKQTVYIIDDYINIKTLRQLQDVQPGVTVTIFSDNLQSHLHLSDVQDFQTEFPNITVDFVTTAGTMHDRFIVLDYGTSDEKMYHCGASAKDAAKKRTTAIAEFTSSRMRQSIHTMIDQLKKNPPLVLR